MTPLSTYTDQELATLLREGNAHAFETIYRNYWDKLYAIAGRRLDSSAEAEEAIQDIFLNLWKRRDTFKLKKGFDNYFAVAVKFEVINRLAKRAREQARNHAIASELITSNETPFYRFDFEQLQKQLEDIIQTLPPKCQLVYRMSRQEEYTNKKIAEELDISEKAVEKHITSANKTLRAKFGSYLTLLLFFF